MAKYLITGGLGFLGQHVVKAILENNGESEMLILARSRKNIFLNELNDKRVKIIYGVNIAQKEGLEQHFRDIDYVIHIAAMISFWYKDKERMHEINVVGTKIIVNLCMENNVKRLIHVSSTATIKGSREIFTAANEKNDYDWEGKSNYDYGLSKLYAEKEVEKGVAMGLDAVIANPCSVVGYGDTKFFPLINTVLKQVPFCFSGGSHMVDVRDLARGITLLITRGKTGERYLLVGDYHSQKEILTKLSRVLEVRPPVFVIASRLLFLAIPILALTDLLSTKSPNLTKTIVENGLHPNFYSNSKSGQILNWEPKYSLDESLQEVVKCYFEVKK